MQNVGNYWLKVILATIVGHIIFQTLIFFTLSYPIIVLYSLTGGNISTTFWELLIEIPLLTGFIHYLFSSTRPKTEGVFMVTLLLVSTILVLFLVPYVLRQPFGSLHSKNSNPGGPMLINGELYIINGNSLERVKQ
jgi:hypothetical protein